MDSIVFYMPNLQVLVLRDTLDEWRGYGTRCRAENERRQKKYVDAMAKLGGLGMLKRIEIIGRERFRVIGREDQMGIRISDIREGLGRSDVQVTFRRPGWKDCCVCCYALSVAKGFHRESLI